MGEGHGQGEGGGAKGCLSAVIWFLLLWFVGWPVAFILAWIYVLLLPFGACIDSIKPINEQLVRILQLPLTFAQNMVDMKPIC
jgi:hypothetical protein